MQTITIIDQSNSQQYIFQNSRILGGLINQVEGFEYPNPIVIVADVANRSGAVAVNSKFGRRLCSFVYRITCDTLEERRNILAVLNQDGILKLIKFTTLDSLSLQFEAYINAVRASYHRLQKPFQIELLAPDYRFYSQTLKTFSTAPTTGAGGSPIPTPIPMDFSSFTGTPNLDVDNDGNVSTPPVFTIHGPGTTFTIQNITTGKMITISTTITAGEEIEIDIANRTILQGSTNIYGLFSGDLLKDMELIPGVNELYFNANSGTDINTSLDVAFRDAYLGV